MDELIKITKNSKGTNIVSARELYSYLGATERFQNWFDRHLQFGFVENIDYAGCEVFNALANQTIKDYALTLDTAKEISMVQRSEQGKLARQYFIACEKKLNQVDLSYENALTLIGVPKEIVPQISQVYRERDYVKKELALTSAKIIEDKPKVVFAESVIGSNGSVLIRQFAKDLCTENFKIGQKKVFEFLIANKYINAKHEPYQKYVDMGVFEVITRTVGSGLETFSTKTTKITGKGAVYFADKIKSQTNG